MFYVEIYSAELCWTYIEVWSFLAEIHTCDIVLFDLSLSRTRIDKFQDHYVSKIGVSFDIAKLYRINLG